MKQRLLVWGLVAATLTVFAGTSAAQLNDQFHYTGWWSEKTIQFWYTTDGHIINGSQQTVTLPYCEWVNIPRPAEFNGVEVTDRTGDWWWVNTGTCALDDPRRTEMHTAVFNQDPGSGLYSFANTGAYLASTGRSIIEWPALVPFDQAGYDNAVLTGNWPGEVFVGVDVKKYVDGGGGTYVPGQQYSFVNGACGALPGFTAGSSAISFNPSVGWATAAPYTGTLYANIGEEGLCPEPALLGLVATAGVCLLRRRRH